MPIMRLSFNSLRTHQPLPSGMIEALKWLAAFLMTVDHVNRHLLYLKYPVMYDMGRAALPLFIFVLAYNLARPEAMGNGAAVRVLERLFPVAVVSCLPYMELNLEAFGWRPLNVLFSLTAGTAVISLIANPTRSRQIAAGVLFAVSGAVVDFGWTGVGLFVCCWQLFRNPSLFWAGSTLTFLLLLGLLNGNHWALAALPAIGLAFTCRLNVPRLRNALYVYYPLHLAVIAALRITLFDS